MPPNPSEYPRPNETGALPSTIMYAKTPHCLVFATPDEFSIRIFCMATVIPIITIEITIEHGDRIRNDGNDGNDGNDRREGRRSIRGVMQSRVPTQGV